MMKGGSFAKEFIKKCLQKDPEKRPYPPDLLEDPWLNFMNQDDSSECDDDSEEEGEE